MVGFVGSINDSFVDFLNPESSSETARDAQLATEGSNILEHSLPFTKTFGKNEEIQTEAQKIREIWQEGYNYRTKEIKRIEPLITGLMQLNDFINYYWDYFTSDEKIRLVLQASYLKQVSDPKYYSKFKNIIKVIFSKKFLTVIKLFIKYYKNIRENPKNNLFVRLQNANLIVAQSIIDLAKSDFYEISLLNKTDSENDFFEMFKQDRLVLSEEDRDLFISLMTDPPKANDKLKQAIKEYRSEYGI